MVLEYHPALPDDPSRKQKDSPLIAQQTTRSFLLAVLLLTLFALTVQAQSGRRQNNPASAPPVPTPTPEPTPTARTKSQQTTDLGFIVAMDRRDTFAGFPISYYDAALIGCADSLKHGSSAMVDVAQQEMSRADAIKKAKDEKTTYVILLKLANQSMTNTTNQSSSDIAIEYTVFAPTTGKVATSGRSYPGSARKGPIVVGPGIPGSNNTILGEQTLKRAGEEAGARILSALHISFPTTPPSH
jgi:hypothetical protein